MEGGGGGGERGDRGLPFFFLAFVFVQSTVCRVVLCNQGSVVGMGRACTLAAIFSIPLSEFSESAPTNNGFEVVDKCFRTFSLLFHQ